MGYTWNLDVSNSKISKNPIENVQDQASVGNSFIKRGTAALKGHYQVWCTACYQRYHRACHHHNDHNFHGKVATRFNALRYQQYHRACYHQNYCKHILLLHRTNESSWNSPKFSETKKNYQKNKNLFKMTVLTKGIVGPVLPG